MDHTRRISVIGLGYVGLPVAVAFGRNSNTVIAFDIDQSRIDELEQGCDRTNEVSAEDLAAANLSFTTDSGDLSGADFHIVTVPTPIDNANRPDLTPLIAASRTVGAQLRRGAIVVYESTVYPGATEEMCIPVLEQESGLGFGDDFTVGYSPERINPGDTEHRFESITKVVSGSDGATLDIVADVYESVVHAGVHRAPNIKTAEAAKVIENTQRDLNIALMNELSVIFEKFGIDTHDVLAAAGTKWNFLPFTPGLVGGHCIGVDPYYLTHRAEQAGYHPKVILAGREINDTMGKYVADTVARLMEEKSGNIEGQTVTVLGITFKENVPDVRNTKVVDLIAGLKSYGLNVQICDPVADADTVIAEYKLTLALYDDLEPADTVILAVAHNAFVDRGWPLVQHLLKNGGGIVADIKGHLKRDTTPGNIDLWRL